DAWRKAMVQLRRTQARVHTAENKRAAMAQAVSEFEPRYAEHRSALLAAREARWRHQEAVADVRLRLAESQHQARIAQERNAAAATGTPARTRRDRRRASPAGRAAAVSRRTTAAAAHAAGSLVDPAEHADRRARAATRQRRDRGSRVA